MVNAPTEAAAAAVPEQQVQLQQQQQQQQGGGQQDGDGPGHLINDSKVGSEGKLFVGGEFEVEHMFDNAYMKGLSRDTNTDSMRAYFESFGEVKDAVVKIDANTGASRGFGFVIFSNEASIDAVFASGSHEIDGKKVKLSIRD